MPRPKSPPSLTERIFSICSPEPNTGCWLWPHAGVNGYGFISVNNKHLYAHRASYEAFKGPIPAGLSIDHLCRVRCCVNPDHLEAVTTRENTLRGTAPTARNAVATHCSRGHEFNEANTWRESNGKRHCRRCGAMNKAAWYRKIGTTHPYPQKRAA